MSGQRYKGFLPGQHPIEGYGPGGFVFAGMSHRGSILALPSGIHAWPVAQPRDLTPDMLQKVLEEAPGTIEVLIVGTGTELVPLPAEVRAVLRDAGIRADPMATRHAISTYNIMMGEKRLAAAALIAEG